jgi:hypothetical protein
MIFSVTHPIPRDAPRASQKVGRAITITPESEIGK